MQICCHFKLFSFSDSLAERSLTSLSRAQHTSKEVNMNCIMRQAVLVIIPFSFCMIYLQISAILLHIDSAMSGLIDHVHLRQSEGKLRTIVTQESHYYSDHDSVNVIFKNFWLMIFNKQWSLCCSFMHKFAIFSFNGWFLVDIWVKQLKKWSWLV